MIRLCLIFSLLNLGETFLIGRHHGVNFKWGNNASWQQAQQQHSIRLSSRDTEDSSPSPSLTTTTNARDDMKNRLLQLIASTPSNAPTTQSLTNQIISVIRQLERLCPTPDRQVLRELGGNWELIWTAQVR